MTPSPAPGERPRPSVAVRAVRTAAAAVLLGAVAYTFVGALDELSTELWAKVRQPRGWAVLGFALVVYAAGLVVSMYSWRVLVVDTGAPLNRRAATRIFFVGMISKLIPGRFWGVVAHVRMGRVIGLPPERMVSAYSISVIVTIAGGGAVGVLVTPHYLHGTGWWLLLLLALPLTLTLRPGWVNHLVALALRLARRQAIDHGAPAALRWSLSLAVAAWLVSGLHLWAIATFLGAPLIPSLLLCVGGFALAAVLGSLAVVLPDGWGVRELALVVPLTAVMPLATASATAVISRLVCLTSEVLTTGVVLLAVRPRGTGSFDLAP